MKREFLKNFKVGEQELPKEIIDAILDENGRDIETTKAKYSDYDALKAQLTEANQAMEGLKALDVDGVRAAADEWKSKYEQAQRDHAAQLADLEFDRLLEGAVSAAKGRNSRAIRALLDVDALKTSKNQAADVKSALDGLKKDNSYLFEPEQTPPPYAPGPGTGGAPISGPFTREDFAKLGYRDRLLLKQTNPEIYETLKE